MTGPYDRARLEQVVPGPEYTEVRPRSAAIIPWTLLAVAAWVVFVLAIVAAASRGEPEQSHSQSPSETAGAEREGTAQALLGAPSAARDLSGLSVPSAGSDGAPPTVDRYRGTATWYCLSGSSACTRGYSGSDLVAAIDTDLGFAKGDQLTVRYRDRSVTVEIVDVCLCGGERLVDLTSGAFRRLAPLGLGVIPVTVELASGAASTLPPTDAGGTMTTQGLAANRIDSVAPDRGARPSMVGRSSLEGLAR